MIEIICIICALDIEYDNIIRYFESDYIDYVDDNWKFNQCNNGDYLIAQSGIGKKAAEECTEYIIKKYDRVSYFISAGIAGAISPELKVGDIVFSNQIVDYNKNGISMELTPKNKSVKTANNAKIICVDGLVNNGAEKDRLFNTYGASCVEMESAGVIKKCNEYNIPFAAVKIISDYADGRAAISMFKTYKTVTNKLGQFLSKIKITGDKV